MAQIMLGAIHNNRLICELPLPVSQLEDFGHILMMCQHINTLVVDRRIHVDVARLALMWKNENAGQQPTVRDVAGMLYNRKICCCTDEIPRSRVLRSVEVLLNHRFVMWPCVYIQLVCELDAHLGRPPTVDDIRQTIANQLALEQAASVNSGVDISPWIKTELLDDDDICSLCLTAMTEGIDATQPQEHYKLPCGHKFHFMDAACIEGTIKRWFATHQTCPLCRRNPSE